MKLQFKSLAKETWKDFESLMGERGGCGGCWCMTWRLKKKDFETHKGAGNKLLIKKMAGNSEPLGVIMYADGEIAGWCSVAPREQFVRLEDSRVLQPLDDKPVWSVSCMFLMKDFRRKGLSSELLKGAIEFAKKKKAKIVEAYPTKPKEKLPDAFVWTGLYSSFVKAGFKKAGAHSPARPIMRYYI